MCCLCDEKVSSRYSLSRSMEWVREVDHQPTEQNHKWQTSWFVSLDPGRLPQPRTKDVSQSRGTRVRSLRGSGDP